MVGSHKIGVVEIGELVVNKNDVVNPTKLSMLAEEGWAISATWNRRDGGFHLLLQRPKQMLSNKHENGSRCPNYCNCLSRESDDG